MTPLSIITQIEQEIRDLWAIINQQKMFINQFRWNDVNVVKPMDGQQVIGWEDYRTIGLVHQGPELFYYREKFGFVNRHDDEDGYGAITHWMPVPFEKGPNEE